MDGQHPPRKSLETWKKKGEELVLYDPLLALDSSTSEKRSISIHDSEEYSGENDNVGMNYKNDDDGGDVNVDGDDKDEIPAWWEQVTLRGLVVSAIIGSVFCVITHKLNLTVGVIPSLNVAAGLLGFFFVKSWTSALNSFGFSASPFTRQENTVIQTCVVACYGIAFSGGFGTYLLAMDERTYNIVGSAYPGNRAQDVKNPALGWMMAFAFVVSFLGIFSLVPLRKIMVIDYKLTYPSGTATAVLINSFHTPEGADVARKQVNCLGKYFTLSFLWSLFKWTVSGIGDGCGLDKFPILGMKAYSNTFYFDFSTTYVGVGMICPHIVSFSVMLGALVSWGIMWPYISSKAGDWYPDGLGANDFKGLYGYKVFIAISVILGDGGYNLAKIIIVTLKSIYKSYRSRQRLPVRNCPEVEESMILTKEERKLNAIFQRDGLSFWIAASGYVALAAIAVYAIPLIFSSLKWYFVLLCYVAAPALAFCNAYGAGLTDWSLASTYGKLGLFIFSSWVGDDGGVMAGLAACGVMMSIVSTASDLMQDFKTGHLTASSPRSMFISQLAGTLVGCIVAPLTFWMFWTAFDVGALDGEYKAPLAVIFREMALIGVQGFSALPSHCLQLCYHFFAAAILLNVLRDTLPSRFSWLVPIPMAMAIPFYIGAYFAIDMFVGSVILFIWEQMNKREAEVYAGAMASGLICGDGIWTIPAAILALTKVNPPLCMSFSST